LQYLYSGGGREFQLITPGAGNKVIKWWALDNGCFNGVFRKKQFDQRLAREDKAHCLFVVMPDKVGDPVETMRLWHEWSPQYRGLPLAFVAQDGQENLPFPEGEWTCLFIGGSTEWKMGQGAVECIKRAIALGKHVHIGRLNSYRRFKHFASLYGGDKFTCDGTMQRFAGRDKAYEIYDSHMDKFRSLSDLPLFGGDSGLQSDHLDTRA